MATATLLTAAEFIDRPDEFDASGNRIKEELIRGEIVPMASPNRRHDWIKTKVGTALILYLDKHSELGLTAAIEYAFEVNANDVFTPDVSVFRTERYYSGHGRLIHGAPEIAIEIVSPSDTADDLEIKIDAYLTNGAQSVWIFFRDSSVMVHTATHVQRLKGDQTLESALLPGFSVPVSSFFAV